MPRRKMMTHRLTYTTVNAICVNLSSEQPEELTLKLAVNLKEVKAESRLDFISKRLTEDFNCGRRKSLYRCVNIRDYSVNERIYGIYPDELLLYGHALNNRNERPELAVASAQSAEKAVTTG